MTKQKQCNPILNRCATLKEGALLVAAFTLLSSAASGTVSAQALDGGTDAGTDGGSDAAIGDAAVDSGVKLDGGTDGAVGDGGATDGAVDAAVDAFVPPLYFTDMTATNFPPPACQDLVDAGSKPGCFTSWLTMSDLDSDGDLDVLFANGGGYYQIGLAEPSSIYTNDGTGAFRDVTATWFGGAVNRLRQTSVGDLDGDGDLDIYQPGGFGLDLDKLWIQTAPRVFENKAATNLPGRLKSKAGSSHFGDIDGDGDLDLAVADWGDIPLLGSTTTPTNGNVWIYLNDGKASFSQQPSSVVPPQIPVTVGRTPIDIDMADIDGDFDLDILVNNRNLQSRLFINDGTGRFTDGTSTLVPGGDPILNYPKKKGAYTYNQELCDIDYDGDLDLLLDNAGRPVGVTSGNYTQININDGKGHFDDKRDDFLFGEVRGDDNAAKCADISGDGKYDIIVAALQNRGEKVFINDGTFKFNSVVNAFPQIIDPSLGIDIADLDGDGILDAITGQGEGGDWTDKLYKGVGLSGKDVTPPTFRTIEEPEVIAPNQPIVIRLAPIDSTTSETGEHVKSVTVSYKAGSAAPKSLKATFIGGDLFRVVIPAQPNGTILTLHPSATDRAGLVSAPVEISLLVGTVVVPEPQVDGGMMPVPDGGASVDSGVTPEADAAVVQPGADAAVVEPGEEEEEEEEEEEMAIDAGTSGGGGTKGSDDGCSIAAPGTSNTTSGLLFGLGLALLVVRRTRITRRRS